MSTKINLEWASFIRKVILSAIQVLSHYLIVNHVSDIGIQKIFMLTRKNKTAKKKKNPCNTFEQVFGMRAKP